MKGGKGGERVRKKCPDGSGDKGGVVGLKQLNGGLSLTNLGFTESHKKGADNVFAKETGGWMLTDKTCIKSKEVLRVNPLWTGEMARGICVWALAGLDVTKVWETPQKRVGGSIRGFC